MALWWYLLWVCMSLIYILWSEWSTTSGFVWEWFPPFLLTTWRQFHWVFWLPLSYFRPVVVDGPVLSGTFVAHFSLLGTVPHSWWVSLVPTSIYFMGCIPTFLLSIWTLLSTNTIYLVLLLLLVVGYPHVSSWVFIRRALELSGQIMLVFLGWRCLCHPWTLMPLEIYLSVIMTWTGMTTWRQFHWVFWLPLSYFRPVVVDGPVLSGTFVAHFSLLGTVPHSWWVSLVPTSIYFMGCIPTFLLSIWTLLSTNTIYLVLLLLLVVGYPHVSSWVFIRRALELSGQIMLVFLGWRCLCHPWTLMPLEIYLSVIMTWTGLPRYLVASWS